jgi:hypothetical protein
MVLFFITLYVLSGILGSYLVCKEIYNVVGCIARGDLIAAFICIIFGPGILVFGLLLYTSRVDWFNKCVWRKSELNPEELSKITGGYNNVELSNRIEVPK